MIEDPIIVPRLRSNSMLTLTSGFQNLWYRIVPCSYGAMSKCTNCNERSTSCIILLCHDTFCAIDKFMRSQIYVRTVGSVLHLGYTLISKQLFFGSMFVFSF